MSEGPAGGALLAAVIPCLLVLALAGGALAAFRGRRRRAGRCAAARDALRASEDRLQWALDATSEIVWDWDLVEGSVYLPSWARTYGFPEERTPRTGEEALEYVHPEDVPRFREAMARVVEGERDALELEHRALTGSGEWRWMLARARVVAREADGRATRLVGSCADISERKRMLARLQIADRMASVGTLAAGVVHEVNTPLACVLANIGWCQEALEPVVGCTPADPGGAAEAARRSLVALRDAQLGAERMRDILRDMRSFSRLEDEVRSPVQVEAALRAALTLADHELRHRARVALEIPPLPAVLASESRLSHVFLNLLVNAAQAIPEGRPERHEVRVTARRRQDGRVEVAVSDTGCGIPPEHLGRLFDPFFTTKAAGGGTGLGLAICHGAVTALGGDLAVESEAGKGSTFRVILPAVSPKDDLAALSVAPRCMRDAARLHEQLLELGTGPAPAPEGGAAATPAPGEPPRLAHWGDR